MDLEIIDNTTAAYLEPDDIILFSNDFCRVQTVADNGDSITVNLVGDFDSESFIVEFEPDRHIELYGYTIVEV